MMTPKWVIPRKRNDFQFDPISPIRKPSNMPTPKWLILRKPNHFQKAPKSTPENHQKTAGIEWENWECAKGRARPTVAECKICSASLGYAQQVVKYDSKTELCSASPKI
jgi:hypothetical protein